jgi:hypothetical protein
MLEIKPKWLLTASEVSHSCDISKVLYIAVERVGLVTAIIAEKAALVFSLLCCK